ncbi:fimbrial protein PefA [Escherichia coli]|uniref:hypothetical protein n=1 Tax=Escherichia coli TaxID=562 RepID=UPI00191909D2|nr:hypothetical protein [Escherichia coli]CAD5758952.1 fimbrial protein PefA [Escherichia coli]
MKKAIIASAITLAVFSGAANAAGDLNAGTFDLNFSGTVSTTTCALEPTINGVGGKNDIALGQTDVNTLGKKVDVVFKPTAAGATGCAANNGANEFIMQWNAVGSSFETAGLKAASGAAGNSHVQIESVNATTGNGTFITQDGFQFTFPKAAVTGAGLQYKVALMGGDQVGDMTATAQVKHWYK